MIITTIGDEIGDTLKEQVSILKKVDVNNIELRKVNSKYLWEFSKKELEYIKEELDINKVTVVTVDTPIGKNENAFNYKNNYELFNEYLKIAKILNAKYLRIFSDIGKCNSQESVIEVLNLFSKLALENEVELIMENEKDTLAESISVCKEIIGKFKNVSILFDIENSNYKGYDIMKEYKNNKTKIKHIHLRDYDENKKVYTYIGEGTLPLEELFKELKNDNYNEVISLETMLPKYNKSDSKENIFIESYLKFVKKYLEA